MPSKSRKKMKGQARKAKAKASASANYSSMPELLICGVSRNILLEDSGLEKEGCSHGDVKLPNFPSACSGFLTEYYQSFFTFLDKSQGTVTSADNALRVAHGKFPEAINKKNFREIIRKNIIGNGADFLLRDKDHSNISMAFATSIMVIDSYDPSEHISPGTFENRPVLGLGIDDREATAYLSNMDVVCGCKRSLVKFFFKRIPCNCVDELYSKLRSTTPKMGKCFCCRQMKERTNLYICTGCERVIYCSKACQIAKVPDHKYMCKLWQRGESFTNDYLHRCKNGIVI